MTSTFSIRYALQTDASEGLGLIASASQASCFLQAEELESDPNFSEVIDYFKSTGEGWQSRMDGVLRQYVAQQANRS